jgi:hypothetical protein
MRVRLSGSRVCAGVLVLVTAVGLSLAGPVSPADALGQAVPSYQTNGRVSSIVRVGDTVYIGGDFTTVRPPGAPAGQQEVARSHLAAFSIDTGQLRPWRPSTNGTVFALAASPNGRTLFVGGDFTQLNGKKRLNVGAVATHKGTIRHFRANTNGPVLAFAVSRSTVYLGGDFTRAKDAPRGRLAAFAGNGRLLHRWKPRASGIVRSLAMSANRTKVYVGGDFTAINRHHNQHFTALGAEKGKVLPWKFHPSYGVWDMVVRKNRVYLGGNGTGGHIQAFTTKGRRVWSVQTDGGVQALAYQRGSVVVGGHFYHVCVGNSPGPVVGFDCPQDLAARRHLLALAHRSGTLKPWDPGASSALGVFALTGGKGAFYAGGDFKRVSGIDQQGFARFAKQ